MNWLRGTPPASQDDDPKPKGFDDYELRLGDLMRGERATMGKSLLDVQRDLKIKATLIAAIENADSSAFDTPGFVAGYVRSYARYLQMDPEWAYTKFCAEAGFAVSDAFGGGLGKSVQRNDPRPRPTARGLDALGDPNARFVPAARSVLDQIEPRAVGSVLVLLLLIGGIGYGGWSVLREVQRVHVAPVEQAPTVIASIDPLGNIGAGVDLRIVDRDRPGAGTGEAIVPAPDALGRMTRPQALDAPVMVARDGPIASIVRPEAEPDEGVVLAGTGSASTADHAPVRVLADLAPAVEIFATSPSWVRVRAADGTVLFEKILDAGESYVVPQAETPATLRAGNSGSVYFLVKGEAFGPAAPGAQVVSNVALTPQTLTDRFAAVDLDAAPDVARIVQVAQARLLEDDILSD